MPRAPKGRSRRRRSSGGGGGSLSPSRLFAHALGGAALGFLEKSFPQLPTVPLLGRKGTIALAAYFFQKGGHGGQLVKDVGIAAATLAGYELGQTGHISGDAGIAAQV